ncbi:protease modulator HflC [Buchnera aphidicola]|uniref:protease modulator HflC n=1 Tax=Buchnera aphidicola TaxID=9 RepID=UPI0034648F2E
MRIYKMLFFLFSFFLIFFSFSFFIIHEGERGIIFRYGKIIRNDFNKPIIYKPGLHAIIPFLESVQILDSRIQTLNNYQDHFFTKEKKEILLSSSIKWKIDNFSRYYFSTRDRNKFQIENFLKRKIKDKLCSEINLLSIKNINSNLPRILGKNFKFNKNINKKLNFNRYLSNGKRNSNLNVFFKTKIIDKSINQLGIKIIDIYVKKIEFPKSSFVLMYDLFFKKEQKIAINKRLKGKRESKKIKLLANFLSKTTISNAKRKALFIKKNAELKSEKLFFKIFSQDVNFYAFIRSLKAYENSIKNTKNVIIISTENNFFKNIRNILKKINK